MGAKKGRERNFVFALGKLLHVGSAEPRHEMEEREMKIEASKHAGRTGGWILQHSGDVGSG